MLNASRKFRGRGLAVLGIALVLAFVWLQATQHIARTIGYRSPAGMWAGVFGFPGIVFANWLKLSVGVSFVSRAAVMFVVNWIFYFTVIEGALALARQMWRPAAAKHGLR